VDIRKVIKTPVFVLKAVPLLALVVFGGLARFGSVTVRLDDTILVVDAPAANLLCACLTADAEQCELTIVEAGREDAGCALLGWL
jgi:hypothetical protein